MSYPQVTTDGGWIHDPAMAAQMQALGYGPSPYGPPGWWVSPAVALASRRLGCLAVSHELQRFVSMHGRDSLVQEREERALVGTLSMPVAPRERVFRLFMGTTRVRSRSRWDAAVALLAPTIPEDVELMATATLLYVLGRVREELP